MAPQSEASSAYGLLKEAASASPEAIAVAQGETAWLTYRELDDRVLRIAAALGQYGPPGSRVMLASKNCPQIVEILFAVWAAGMVVVPVNAKLHAREVADIASDCAPVLALTSAGFREAFTCPAIIIGSPEYADLGSGEPAAPAALAPGDLAWLFYTSGTTGRSKGAMLTHANLAAMAQAHWQDIDLPDADVSLIHAAPMSHGSGLYILPYIAKGARQVVPASGAFEPDEVLRLCRVHPGATMFLAPTMVQRLRLHVEQAGVDPAGCIRLIVYGGGPMYVGEMRRALATFGPIFAQIYGQGESPMTITGLSAADHVDQPDRVLGSVGRARSGVEVRVVDDDGNACPPGTAGEILCRGATVMAGYLGLPEASAAALKDGWLHTGDVGALDNDGYLTLLDRSKDLIISGGSNIYPREVEEALIAHPWVEEACVVGRPDAEWGEIVVAHVVAKPGADVTAAALDEHCLARIARFKRPKHYVFADSLPKNAYGKVLKRELRES